MKRPGLVWLNIALDGLLIGYAIAASVQTSVGQLPDATFVSKYITPLIALGFIDAILLFTLSGAHHPRPKGLFLYFLFTRLAVIYIIYRVVGHGSLALALTIDLGSILLIGLTLLAINKFSFSPITKL